MAGTQSDLLQGTLDVLILKALALQELHGMGISRRIAQMTNEAFDVKAGSLFPALHRMEQAGWLTSSWGQAETNRRAKFYSLTKKGTKQLLTETKRWARISLV
jgi:PadR family transcriptional regulator, regulatory protein PadR